MADYGYGVQQRRIVGEKQLFIKNFKIILI